MQRALPGSARKSQFFALFIEIEGSLQPLRVRVIETLVLALPALTSIVRAAQVATIFLAALSSGSFTTFVPAPRKRTTFFFVSRLKPSSKVREQPLD